MTKSGRKTQRPSITSPERAQSKRSDPCHCGTCVNLAAFVYPNNIHHEDILANPGTEYGNGGGHQQDCVYSPRKGELHAVHIEVLVHSVSVIVPTPLDPTPRYPCGVRSLSGTLDCTTIRVSSHEGIPLTCPYSRRVARRGIPLEPYLAFGNGQMALYPSSLPTNTPRATE
jgi:hypothetical protein